MDANEIIPLISAVATAGAAFGTLLTVSEMKKQREGAYLPELILLPINFKANALHKKDVCATNWRLMSEKAAKNNQYIKNNINIPLLNIGLAAAKEIKVTWMVPINELVNDVNALIINQLDNTYFEFEKKILSFESKQYSSFVIPFLNSVNMIDYSLPASINENPIPLAIPFCYQALISALVHFSFKNGDGYFDYGAKPLVAVLEYKSIDERPYKKKFEINFELSTAYDKGNYFIARLIPKIIR